MGIVLKAERLAISTCVGICLAMIPLVLTGAAIGIWLLRKMPQKVFEKAVLILSAVAAVNLLF